MITRQSKGKILTHAEVDGNFTELQTGIAAINAANISTSVTKTVGAGKDFETLHLALRWAEKLIFLGNGKLTLEIDDGTHVLGGAGEFNENAWAYYAFINSRITFKSVSGIAANCIITLDAFDDNENWPSVITAYLSNITVMNITIDGSIGGYPYSAIYFLNAYDSSSLAVRDSILKNCRYPVYSWLSNVYFSNISTDNIYVGAALGNSNLTVFNLTMQNFAGTGTNNRGIDARTYSTVSLHGTNTIDSTTNRIFNGLRIDENSKLFFDNWGGDALTIKNADVAIKVEGNSTLGTEIVLPITIENCNLGFQISYNSSVYLADAPTFITTTTEYNIPLNTVTNDGSEVLIDRVDFTTENGFINHADGSATLPNVTNTEIDAKGAKALITKEYAALPKVIQETALATYTPDLEYNDYFEYTVTQATTIANPTNAVVGKKGILVIKQDTTGGRVTTFDTDWIFPAGAPVLNTLANKINFIRYTVVDTNKILAEFIADL